MHTRDKASSLKLKDGRMAHFELPTNQTHPGIGHELYLPDDLHDQTLPPSHPMHVRQGDKSPLSVCKTCLQYSTAQHS